MPGRTDRHVERTVARMLEQIGPRVARRPFARFDERPVGDEAAQDKGLARAFQQRIESRPPIPYAPGHPREAVDNGAALFSHRRACRSEEHTSELPSLMRTSYAASCLTHTKTTQPSTARPPQMHTSEPCRPQK